MPRRYFNPTVMVRRNWSTDLHYVGSKPQGIDERRFLVFAPGTKFEKWPSTLTLDGPAGQDVALIREDGGTALLTGQAFLDLVHSGVLFERGACDAQEHATEAEYRACPDCFPPHPWDKA